SCQSHHLTTSLPRSFRHGIAPRLLPVDAAPVAVLALCAAAAGDVRGGGAGAGRGRPGDDAGWSGVLATPGAGSPGAGVLLAAAGGAYGPVPRLGLVARGSAGRSSWGA